MKGKAKIILASALLSWCCTAYGQGRWSLETNLPTWALLGTINAGVNFRTADHWSIEAGARYNPFTYMGGGERQTQLRQLTPHIGIRYWLGTVYEGWYLGARLLASEYSVSLPARELYFDGDLAGIGLKFGYCRKLTDSLALSLGLGGATAYNWSTYYCGPVCGRIVDRRRGIALFPSDVTVSLMYML